MVRKFTKSGDSENSFLFRSYTFSNHCLLFFSWEIAFLIGYSGTGYLTMLHHEQMISGEEIYTLITFMVSFMASNTVKPETLMS